MEGRGGFFLTLISMVTETGETDGEEGRHGNESRKRGVESRCQAMREGSFSL